MKPRMSVKEVVGKLLNGERDLRGIELGEGSDLSGYKGFFGYRSFASLINYMRANTLDLQSNPVDIGGSGFRYVKARGLYLPSVKAENADFEGADLSGSEFGSEFSPARFNDANFKGSVCVGTRFVHASLEGADLSGGDFRGASFYYGHLRGAKLVRGQFDGATFEYGGFPDADATGASFKGATLKRGCFRDAKLAGADLSKANLSHSRFDGADLTGAKVEGATILGKCGPYELSFEGATTNGVDFSHAFFENTGAKQRFLEEVGQN